MSTFGGQIPFVKTAISETVFRVSDLSDLILFERPTFGDGRGFFHEYFRQNELQEVLGHDVHFVQANHSQSKKGVLRGVHVANFDKLLYVPHGDVEVFLVDLRSRSKTFGSFVQLALGDAMRASIFVPAGFGNSYCVLSDEADYMYLVTAYYDPKNEVTVAWNDPDLALPWTEKHPILSERDTTTAQSLRTLFPESFPADK